MNKMMVIRGKQGERGLSLLEYAAGAAVIASIVFFGMQAFGTSVSGFFTALGGWATARGAQASN